MVSSQGTSSISYSSQGLRDSPSGGVTQGPSKDIMDPILNPMQDFDLGSIDGSWDKSTLLDSILCVYVVPKYWHC